MTHLAGSSSAVTERFKHSPDFHQLIEYTDARSKKSALKYDVAGRLLKATDPLGNSTTFEPMHSGQPGTTTIGSGDEKVVSKVTYDGYDVRTMSVGNATTTIQTDEIGRPVGQSDGRGNASYTYYDNLSRPRATINSHGKMVRLNYDENGNLTQVVDAGGTTTTYTYDKRNRLESITDPFGKVERWSWDGNDNLSHYIDRRGQRTDFSYDDLDRPFLISYADGTSTQIDYSIIGQEAEVKWTEGTRVITQRLDAFDRLKYEITPQGRVDYRYDDVGRRTRLDASGTARINYVWDDANRLDLMRLGTLEFDFSYDKASRLKRKTLPNGIQERYSYNTSPMPTGISYYKGGAQTDAFADTWDGDGRPIVRTGTGSVPRANLPTETEASYDRNRLTELNGKAWTYDEQGNLTSDGIRSFVWDARNQLKEIKQGAAVLASFEYDAFGRRISKTVSGATTTFLYDGDNPIREQRGANQTQIVTGGGIDQYLARIEGGINRYYVTDLQGSTLALTDEAGNTRTAYTYEAYGETTRSGDPNLNAFQYTGRENDGTGLYYYRTRYYDPVAKRFIAEDTIGQTGGLNLYEYVGGDPVNFVDPMGEFGYPIAFELFNWIFESYSRGCLDWGRFASSVGLGVALGVFLPVRPGPLGASGIRSLSPASIRFSQSSVNGVADIVANMRANGWRGPAIDVVRMRDGGLTAFDNTRVLAASRAGIDVRAVVRDAADPFPLGRWTPRSGVQPATWGDAVRVRIQQQNAGFRNTYPNGSPYTGSAQ